MTTDEKILKTLEDLQAGQRALQTDVKTLNGKVDNLEADVTSVKDVQQKQGIQLDNVELKVEAIHEYQKKAHTEIMEHLIESNEINGQEQQELEKRITRIEKHLGLPPLK